MQAPARGSIGAVGRSVVLLRHLLSPPPRLPRSEMEKRRTQLETRLLVVQKTRLPPSRAVHIALSVSHPRRENRGIASSTAPETGAVGNRGGGAHNRPDNTEEVCTAREGARKANR